METTEQTRALAQDILDYIGKYPERHEQSSWLEINDSSDPRAVTEGNLCNTTMCIAGTAVFLSRALEDFRDFEGDWQDEGARLLGLECEESDALFYYAGNKESVDMVRALADGDQDALDKLIEDMFYFG